MTSCKLNSERGVALATAVIAATVVFLLAAAALNISMGRFQLATAQVTRRAAFYASESGIRYGFARLDADQPNNACEGQADTSIKDKTKLCSGFNPYVISSKSGIGAHEVKPELKMGNFDVTVTIRYQSANPPSQPNERWKVTAVAR